MAVNKIFDASYAPVRPVDNRPEHLIGFIPATYSDLYDDETKKSFTAQIRKVCMQTGSAAHDNNANDEQFKHNKSKYGPKSTRKMVRLKSKMRQKSSHFN